jgi:hypothetical protein
MEEKLGKATDPEVKRQLTELLRKIKRNF